MAEIDVQVTQSPQINVEVTATGSGTSDYSELTNKPKINGVTLNGNKSTSDLGIVIPTKTSDLTNDSGFLTSHQDISGKADLSYVNSQLATKQDTLTAGANINIASGVISATDTTYTAGSGISIVNGVISLNLTNYDNEEF